MGVAPYSWPHQREWRPGINDRRTSPGLWIVLIIYLIFFIGFALNMGPQLLTSGMLPVLAALVIVLGGIAAAFLVGMTSRKDVRVEERKYFDIAPDRLSQVVQEALDLDHVVYRRDGPTREGEREWSDVFHLTGPSLDGIVLAVEGNPLIAMVDKASVTVRGTSRMMEAIERLKHLVDGAATREMVNRYERELHEGRPELVLYGGEGGSNGP